MPLDEEAFISRVSLRQSVSPDAVRTILRALRPSGGSMAQFSYPEFGGMSQWSSGMSMIGGSFNPSLKSKLNAVCTELAAYVAAETPSNSKAKAEAAEPSYFASDHSEWWPSGLGTPSAVGGQNELKYAVFPRRLIISESDRVEIYDTGDHRIFGIAQALSAEQTLTFTSKMAPFGQATYRRWLNNFIVGAAFVCQARG